VPPGTAGHRTVRGMWHGRSGRTLLPPPEGHDPGCV